MASRWCSHTVSAQAIQAIALLAHEEALHQEIFQFHIGVLEAFVLQAHLTNYMDTALGGTFVRAHSLRCWLFVSADVRSQSG